MNILNLYAGIGGNRKNWGEEHNITAVEYNEDIAKVYGSLYPKDTLIIGDAHKYLLENYKKFDFIWSSPPCQSHSQIRICGARRGQHPPVYPDMKLWEEIIFLQNYALHDCLFVVENVKPYYNPLIKPRISLGRHLFWSNFRIPFREISKGDVVIGKISNNSTVYGANIKDFPMPSIKHKKQILRNMVNPELGKYILDTALEKETFQESSLF